MSRIQLRKRLHNALLAFQRIDDPASPDEVIRLVPERGVPIGSLLLLFYPRRSTGYSSPKPGTLSAHHEQVIALDPRLPPGWTGADVATYLERLAAAYREDTLCSAEELESVAK